MRLNNLLQEAKLSFSRSGGKGGQNVNKVETKVELWFNISGSRYLTDTEKELLTSRLRNRIDREGNIRIVSQTGRTQQGNRKKATEKFLSLIEKNLRKPKSRIPTKISKTANERRLESKRMNSRKKKARSKLGLFD